MKEGMSVVIPYYLGEGFIYRNIDSLLVAHSYVQDLIEIEIIVILDSTENQEDIESKLLAKYGKKVNIHKNKNNIGVAATRNKGWKLANFNWVTFIDQDDTVTENYFSVIGKKLDQKYDIILLNGYYKHLIQNKKVPIYYFKPKISIKTLLDRNKIHTPGLVILNRATIKNYPVFTEGNNFAGVDDWGAYINIYLKSKKIHLKYLRYKLLNYNIHSQNYSNDIIKALENAINLFKSIKENNKYKKYINRTIMRLNFEKEFFSKKSMNLFYFQNFNGAIYYLFSKSVDFNKLIGFLHKKIIKMRIRF